MRDRTYAPQRRRGHAHVWHRIARLPYARPYAQKGIRPGDTTGISGEPGINQARWDPRKLNLVSNCMRRQTYAQAKPLHTSSIKCTTLRLYVQAPYAHASRGIAVRSLYQITLCTNCMRRQNPMRKVFPILAGGHVLFVSPWKPRSWFPEVRWKLAGNLTK